ncbi:MAG: copper-exporting P-type ATPase A [Thermonema sp.]|uniref:heavy metal translocating P-type ATPase n=1 Tax=Thermonema sp. TaxID=2231181 RepID=UPI0021DF2987|nr:cation-translocating P-type ATPase [Thermonema sp.]GIV40132.1 MAG: copper-exporting P-type ATPase A [Thermonema sp.]
METAVREKKQSKQAGAATQVHLKVSGMSCTNCALGVERYLSRKGVEQPKVDFASGDVIFYLPEGVALESLMEGIRKLGYEVQPAAEAHASAGGMDPLLRQLIIAWAFTLPLLLAMVLPYAWLHNPYVQLGLSLPVFAIGVHRFGRSAWHSVRSGVANMDVLILTGATAALVYSIYGLWINGGHDYMFFETAASIISIVLLGNYMEHRAVKQTTSAVDELTQLQKATAKRLVVHPSGRQVVEEVPADSLTAGDVVLLAPGDVVPADGEVVEGAGAVNEALISGESLPVEKQAGDHLMAGTEVVDGAFRMQVQQAAGQTVLSQIIDLVRQAQARKPSIQRLADRVSAVFVPAVILIALLTFAANYWVAALPLSDSITRAIAVLVISCPCAMGLAVPTAVTVALGRAAKAGILLRGADTLERLQRIQYVLFDKTGTLTTGDFEVKQIDTFGAEPGFVRRLLLAMEQPSSHPIARALTRRLQHEGIEPFPLHSLREVKGVGMEAEDEKGNRYRLGSFRLLNDEDQARYKQTYDLFLLCNDVLIAAVAIEDQVKPYAPALMQYLHKRGIRTVLVSGDKEHKCRRLAQQVGIDEVYAEQTPEQKLQKVESLAAKARVAMVGDGINDAPALSRAHVGISLSNATQVAINAAQVILLDGDLRHLQTAFEVGAHTVRVMKQNLFWAFFYNVLAIPVAAVGWLSPMVAALAMACSDVIVVFNSLRLRWMKFD